MENRNNFSIAFRTKSPFDVGTGLLVVCGGRVGSESYWYQKHFGNSVTPILDTRHTISKIPLSNPSKFTDTFVTNNEV
jgi:hypothetical protein